MKTVLKNIVLVIISLLLIAAIAYAIYGACNYYFIKTPNPEAVVELENYGTIKIELYPEYAPNTVANFIKLAEAGYYNGKVIYGKDELGLYFGRNEDGEVDVPTKDLIDPSIEKPEVDEEGNPKVDLRYEIPGEFISNGFEKNTLSHEQGVISMIRYDFAAAGVSTLAQYSNNSATSQIRIMTGNFPGLNGLYAAFGKIVEGYDIVEKIANETKTKESEDTSILEFENKPKITSVTIDTHGIDYGIPETEEYFDYQTFMTNYMSQYVKSQQAQ